MNKLLFMVKIWSWNRNWNRNFSKVGTGTGTGTVKNSYGSTVTVPLHWTEGAED